MSATSGSRDLRYEPHENPPFPVSLGLGLQRAFVHVAGILVAPVIVAKASMVDDSYLAWLVFATMASTGVGTLLQVFRFGPMGVGYLLPLYTFYSAIPFCIMALTYGGPATLITLLLASALFQIGAAKWLFTLRRIITPTLSGTMMMLVAAALAPVTYRLLDTASETEPVGAPVAALVTLVVIVALVLRAPPVLRLWAPVTGILAGCILTVIFGGYDFGNVVHTPWVGFPVSGWPGLRLDFGPAFWSLLPAFLFVSAAISLQASATAITLQSVSWRQPRAIDFRRVQGAVLSTGVGNLLAGIAGTVPNSVDWSIIPFIQTTGVAARRVGIFIAGIYIALALLPKASGLFSSIPQAVIVGYLIVIIGVIFFESARTIVQDGLDHRKIIVAGVSFWIGVAFEYQMLSFPNIDPASGWAVLQSGITTGGFTALALTLFLELTNRRMRFQSQLDVAALPELNAFIRRFATRHGWNSAMERRLYAVAEETLLTLAPIDADANGQQKRQLVVLASRDDNTAQLEFIGAASEGNLEDRISQLRQHSPETTLEREGSLRLLRHYATSVRHQQYHETDVVTVRVNQPDA